MKNTRTITNLSVLLTLVFAFSLTQPAVATRNVPGCSIAPAENRVIINFSPDKVIRSDSNQSNSVSGPVATSIESGNYEVTLESYDDHSDKSHQSQPHEEWFLSLENSSNEVIATSSAIGDIPEDVDVFKQIVETDFSVSETVSFATAVHNVYPDNSSPNSLVPICAAFDKIEEQEESKGSINVCKLIIDEEGNVVEGNDDGTKFIISGNHLVDALTSFPGTEFQTPLTLNTDIVVNSQGEDAQCVLYEDLPLGDYFYGPEIIVGDNWNTPKYNDQFDHDVEDLDDFFSYEFSGSNKNSDGHIILTEERPNRELVVLNEIKFTPECPDTSPHGYDYDFSSQGGNKGDDTCEDPNPDPDPDPDPNPHPDPDPNPDPEPNSCPLTDKEGRIIIDFGNKTIRADKTEADATAGPIAVSLSAGKYTVTAVSYDDHSSKPSQTQPNEQFYFILKNSEELEVGVTGSIGDLPNNLDQLIEVIEEGFNVPEDVASVTAFHSFFGGSVNSIVPVCAAFDLESKTNACSDGIDNDGDGNVDYPEDLSCESPEDDDENTPPVITLIDGTVNVFVGTTFTDPGATASDEEDGDITTDIVLGGDTVDTNTLGAYVITYNVTDSQGASATQVTRTVNVIDETPQCSDGEDNDGDQLTDEADSACHTDGDPENPESYDPNINNENSPPVITVLGDDPLEVFLGTTFTDPSATAADEEDGDITSEIIINGDVVNTNVEGDYNVIYKVTDSGGLMDEKSRTVSVVPFAPTECNDGIDNDGDGLIDISDNGCHTDNDENNFDSYDPNDESENTAPTITLVGDATISLTVGDSFTDQGATASDVEDGDITSEIVTGGDSVDANTVGTYVITYDVTDSDGASATQIVRTVNVSSGGGGGGGGGGGSTGGGGGGLPPLIIDSEVVTVPSSGVAVITWRTNIPATSQVVYDDESHPNPTVEPTYGYEFLTTETVAINTTHRIEITGLTAGIPYYFRPVSKAQNVNRGYGKELTFVLAGGGGGLVIASSGPTQCTYLEDFLRIDFQNDPEEVIKLQTFLRDYEGFASLEVTGIFDQATFDAVSAFQEKYRSEILDPWGITSPTGYVYYTTQKKINEIYCNQTFSLTTDQLSEIEGFRSLLEQIQSQPGVPAEEIEGLEGQVGVAPSVSSGGETLAVTTISGGSSGLTGGAGGGNLLEGSASAGALGFIPENTGSIQEGSQTASLIGTVGTSGALAVFEGVGGGTGSSESESKKEVNTGLLATAMSALTPSAGRGITVIGIVILLAYLVLLRAQEKAVGSWSSGSSQGRLDEYVPEADEESEGTILEV